MDNTWRDNIYIQHRRSYQEWTIHEETISTFSTEEAIKNGQYMKRQYLHWAQKKLSRMDNTWRDTIYIQHRRSSQEWTIHEETISAFSTEEAIKNGQYMKRQYLHWAQKKLSRMDNTWRDNIYIQHRRSYQEWTIHEETIPTLSTEEAIKNGKYKKRQYIHTLDSFFCAQCRYCLLMYCRILDSFFCAQCRYCLFVYFPFLIASSVLNIDIVSSVLSILDSFFCAECRYCLFMYCPFLIASSVLNVDIVSSCIVHSW
jgi:hypothetical protein